MFDRRLAAVAFLVLGVAPALADLSEVRINEFVASNATGVTDEDGEFSDWIELHNTGATLVSLGGAFLTDTAADLDKWTIPAVDIAPGGFLVVFASNKNRTTPGSELHTNFRLGAGGEYLGLVAPDATTVISEYAPTFPPQATDIAYGVGPGLAVGFLDPPTPGAANGALVQSVLPVEFDTPHGFYDAPVNVGMTTATPGAQIRYTTDGSLPTDTHGTVYAGPVPITTTTVLRVGAFKVGLQPSRIVSHTLIYRAAVLTQTGAGYPSTWGTRPVDYAMDPTVVNDPSWSGEMMGSLLAIPSVSIVTDIQDLFGANGIYSNPNSRGDEWERLVSMELIFGDGSSPGFATACGLEIHGNTSRGRVNPKHSMRVTFKPSYGPATLSFPLFPGSPVTEFRSLVFRAGWQDGWIHARGKALFLRDQFANDTQIALGQVATYGRFVHLYLNGLYWGVYGMHERATDWFAAFHFGGDHDEYDVMKDGKLDEGERVAWDTMFGLMTPDVATPAGYAAVQQYLDVDNLIDFVLTHHYVGNNEWSSSWVATRRRLDGETFKFISWDSERTLKTSRRIPGLVGSGPRPQGAYGFLRRYSADFRATFAQHVQQHYFGGGALTPAAATARFMARADELYAPLLAESARWGDHSSAGDPFTRDDWIVERDRLLADFFPVRSDIVVEKYERLGLYP